MDIDLAKKTIYTYNNVDESSPNDAAMPSGYMRNVAATYGW